MTLTILSLEDEADVRDALERDLEQFWDKIRLEVAEDVDDAWAVIERSSRTGTSWPSSCPTIVCPESRAWTSSWSS